MSVDHHASFARYQSTVSATAASSERAARQPSAVIRSVANGVAAVVLGPVVLAQVDTRLVAARRPARPRGRSRRWARPRPRGRRCRPHPARRARPAGEAPRRRRRRTSSRAPGSPSPHTGSRSPRRARVAHRGTAFSGCCHGPMQFVGPRDDDVDPVGIRARQIVGDRLRAGVGAGRKPLARELVVLAERVGGARAVDLVGRHVHDPARPGLRRGVEHRAGAGDVRVEEDLRGVLAPGHVRLGGEVDDERGPLAPHDVLDLGRCDVGTHGLDKPRRHPGQPALVARIRVEVDVQDRLAVGRQGADERRADEAEAARDEHPAAHGSSIPSPASGSSEARAWARKRRTSSAS